MKRIVGKLLALVVVGTLAPSAWAGERPRIGVWVSPGGPSGIWEKAARDPWPAKMVVGDLADLGVTDIFFFEQKGRGGPFLHPTKVQHATSDPRMRDRDWLGELLDATAGRAMRVWLAWTPPGDKYPGTEFRGLNHPAIQKIYLDEIEEVAARYGRRGNLAGILWHEVDCSEHPDLHEDDRDEFSAYCRRTFGQPYRGTVMPPAVDSQDPWWRRFALYKIHVVNQLVGRSAEVARRHGLKTSFCSYTPETFPGESWRWGYDVVALEQLCDEQWFSGYSLESGKAYQQIRGAWLDFGPSYQGQILARNYAYAMHGRRVSYFEYRTPLYLEPMRRYYSAIKSFTEKYGDIYAGYLGHSEGEVALFYGKQRLGDWLRTMAAWQGGVSTAAVAVAVHPTPFMLAHPASPGGEYEKKVRGLMLALSAVTDVDGLVLESRHALDVKNLLHYRLIVIPEDMGRLLSAAMAHALRQYVDQGGRLLVVATRLSRGRADLADEVDLTGELCGLEIAPGGLPGYVRPEGSPDRFWAGCRLSIRAHGAKVCLREQETGQPLLVEQRGVAFSAVGFSPDAADFFQAAVGRLISPPVRLEAKGNLRILEGVSKDGLACFTLWGRGRGTLRVDTGALGLNSPRWKMIDLVSGAALAGQPGAGIPVEIKYPNQPLLVVVGSPEKIAPLHGLYASADVFRDLPEKTAVDSPEVPREALGGKAAPLTEAAAEAKTPSRDREIGIVDYAARYETSTPKRALIQAGQECSTLIEAAGLKPAWVDVNLLLPAGRGERNRYKRIFVPSSVGWLSQPMLDSLADYVQCGGLLVSNASLILLDANANYKADPGEGVTHFAADGFLGVFGHGGCTMDRLKVVRPCPLTAGLPDGWFPLAPIAGGRRTTIRSAETLILASGNYKEGRVGQQPFLTFKHSGRGTAIYLVGQVGPKSDPQLKRILTNILAPETLAWLCWQGKE
jgi:hypothetical protein